MRAYPAQEFTFKELGKALVDSDGKIYAVISVDLVRNATAERFFMQIAHSGLKLLVSFCVKCLFDRADRLV
jgi:hypothetical protein